MVHFQIQLPGVTASSLPKAFIPKLDFEFAALEQAENYRNALLRLFAQHLHGRVLEVGAGIGQLTGLLLQTPAIRHLVSVEPDPRFCECLRNTFPDHAILHGTIRDLTEPGNWDAILSVNVLEHIEDDDAELKGYHALLRQTNGVFCLFVPARPEIYAPLDKDFGHFRRYTRHTLKQKLQQAGFRILQLYYFNFVGYLTWWLSFCALKKRSFNSTAIRYFDRLVFPPFNAFETRIFRPPIGQSLVTVARAE